MAAIWANQIKNQSGSVTKNVSTLVDSNSPPRVVQSLPYAGGWSKGSSPYNRPLGFMYDPVSGMVSLFGTVARSKSAGSGITALPAEYAPPNTTGFAVPMDGSATVCVILGKNQAGTGQINAPGGASAGSLIFFDGVSYYVGAV